MAYDCDNPFAKILRGELPCRKVYESEHALAFHDIAPHAPVHVLVIPKGPYQNYAEFMATAKNEEILDFFRAVQTVAHAEGVGNAFRLITQNGASVGQTVHHFHVHVIGGKPMSKLGVE